MHNSHSHDFPPHYFARYDESDDSLFYHYPRLTSHIDHGAIMALRKLFLHELPFEGVLLDIMSSYHSHIPPELPVNHMVGLGLNAEEMRQNPQLHQFLVHNLNQTPRLPFDSASFDGAICTVSVQYLVRPVEVFAEVGRVLRPNAPFVVTFSNRCFPSKAVKIWLTADQSQRLELVQLYFYKAGCFGAITGQDLLPGRLWGDTLCMVRGRRVPVPM